MPLSISKEAKDLRYEDKKDGLCFAQSHLACHRIQKEFGITPKKIWIFGDVSLLGDKTVKWAYHVAPVVDLENGKGDRETFVLDPVLSQSPLHIDQWKALMSVQPRILPAGVSTYGKNNGVDTSVPGFHVITDMTFYDRESFRAYLLEAD